MKCEKIIPARGNGGGNFDWSVLDDKYKQRKHSSPIPKHTGGFDKNTYKSYLMKAEGGYNNNPKDRGGCTKWGVTKKALRTTLGREVNCDDIKNITDEQWNTTFDRFISSIKDIDDTAIAYIAFEWVWGTGDGALKHCCKEFGASNKSDFIQMCNNASDRRALFYKMRDHRARFLYDLSFASDDNATFRNGWLKRTYNIEYDALYS